MFSSLVARVTSAGGSCGRASSRAPWFVLLRPDIGLNVDKLEMLLSFKIQGARLVEVSLDDHAGLVAAVAQVDVVISAMAGSSHNLLQQHKIVVAIKKAGNIKVRCMPTSKFANTSSDLQFSNVCQDA